MENNYVYLKHGANILRIEKEILLDKTADCSKYLEVMVFDGHGLFHFEKNMISVLIAEDVDLRQLETTNNPLDFIYSVNNISSSYLSAYKKLRNQCAHAKICKAVSLSDKAKKRLIAEKSNVEKRPLPTKNNPQYGYNG